MAWIVCNPDNGLEIESRHATEQEARDAAWSCVHDQLDNDPDEIANTHEGDWGPTEPWLFSIGQEREALMVFLPEDKLAEARVALGLED